MNKEQTFEKALQQANWLKNLNASGYAGCTSQGQIVDRRENPDAYPIAANSMFGVVKPKKLDQEPHPEYFTGM